MSLQISLRNFLSLFILCWGVVSFGFLGSSEVKAQGYSTSYKFLKAVDKKNYADIQKYIRSGVNINTRDFTEGKTALYKAATSRDVKLIRYLLKYDAKPDVPDKKTRVTPIMVSAELGDASSVRSFVRAKASLDLQDINGETVLIKSLRSGKRKIVEMLLKAGADTTLVDYTGRTALAHAKENGRIRAIVKILEKHGAVE
jgi:ankyrin repeat protein